MIRAPLAFRSSYDRSPLRHRYAIRGRAVSVRSAMFGVRSCKWHDPPSVDDASPPVPSPPVHSPPTPECCQRKRALKPNSGGVMISRGTSCPSAPEGVLRCSPVTVIVCVSIKNILHWLCVSNSPAFFAARNNADSWEMSAVAFDLCSSVSRFTRNPRYSGRKERGGRHSVFLKTHTKRMCFLLSTVSPMWSSSLLLPCDLLCFETFTGL